MLVGKIAANSGKRSSHQGTHSVVLPSSQSQAHGVYKVACEVPTDEASDTNCHSEELEEGVTEHARDNKTQNDLEGHVVWPAVEY